jgi:type IV secretion system protein VirB10
MSEDRDGIAAVPPKEDPETLVLRGTPRLVVRFRRGLIIGITGAVALSLAALAWVALEPPSFRMVAEGESGGERAGKSAPDVLAGAPSSYGDVPRLGPPLPGDLGRPILEHQRSLEQNGTSLAPSKTPAAAGRADAAHSAADAERQRLAAAQKAARSSGVLVQIAGRGGAEAPRALAEPESAGAGNPAAPTAAPPEATQAGGARRLDFAGSGSGDVNPGPLRAAPSRWTLSAGTIIPASLITGLNSDLPGTVFAQVTEHVRDSATGRTVLIPQGARLVGSYDSLVAYGQRRALLVWQRIVFPDGSSIRLDNLPAADLSGFAGVRDRVDRHTGRLLSGIVLSTLLGVGTELGLGSGESNLVRAVRESTQQKIARAGDQLTTRNLDVQPTLTVRPGWPLRAVIHKDLVLQPWRG